MHCRREEAKLEIIGNPMLILLCTRFIGVSDIANVRFSLPAQLLEPTPNLEYWNYLDQPSTFVAVGDSEEPLDRMLEVLRFWFTKVYIHAYKETRLLWKSKMGLDSY